MRQGTQLLLAILMLAGCTSAQRPSTFRVAATRCEPCRIDALAGQLAGTGAEDCGWARTGAQRAQVQACALRALETERPFHALMTMQGIDSIVVHAFVRTPAGEYIQLTSDSDPGGGMRACHTVVARTPCARLVADAQRTTLTCVDPGAAVRICEERAQRAQSTSDTEDARLLACNPLPGAETTGFCLRLPAPSGNVPPGLQLTCEPFAPEAPNYLVCRTQEQDIQRTR
ncbi:MAG: hypothetical protein L0Y66_02180 [Myxococcaceae bacterium]|nr:hypothetical protein [Myxococcaceae bacterium]MCI0670573.1 hypothetical protein [Myxococcaceae bacterium]